MKKMVFIYFGDSLFGKLKEVCMDCDWNYCKHSYCKAFNCLNISSELCVVNDVFLGWSYALLKSDQKIFISGFRKTENSLFEQFASVTGNEISDISCHLDKLLLLTKNGCCYFLRNKSFKLIPIDFKNAAVKVKGIAVGETNSLALSEDGKVFVLDVSERISPVCLEMQMKIAEISCGKEHNMLLSNYGQVLSYGNGSRGQLGHGTIANVAEPLLLDALDGIAIKAIAAGGWHSAAVSSAGDLYAWGWNESGQLGLPCAELHKNTSSKEVETICCLPKLVEFENDLNVTSVSCGSRHTAAITNDDQVWTWGWNAYGQLGHKNYKVGDKPEKVSLPEKLKPERVKCVYWSTIITGSVKD